MVVVRPFRGLRPKKELAEKVASPPYDVLDSEEARQMAASNSISFLRVIKPEIDLPPETDIHGDSVYLQGAENLKNMISEGTMIEDSAPYFYFYRQIMAHHSQYGLVATVSAKDYENGLIKKHEFTRPDKEADRVRHIITQSAQCGPVFLTYPDIKDINCLQTDVCAGQPDIDFVSPDDIRHTLWPVTEPKHIAQIQDTFHHLKCLYVADGHHRSAAGTIVANKRKNSPAKNTFQ